MKLITQHVFIGIFTIVYCQENTFGESSVSLASKSIFHRMTFRDPVVFSPYVIKPGFININGTLSRTMILNDSSTVNNQITIPNISGKVIEIDLIRANIPYLVLNQNYFDFQLGIGIQFTNYSNDSSSFASFFPDTLRQMENIINQQNFYFYPQSFGLNINTTLSWQFSPKRLTYLYYSIGYNNLNFYESDIGERYLKGSGISNNIGAGVRFIFRKPQKNYNFYWGIEGKMSNVSVNNVADPKDISPINGINLNGFIISLTTGILFGGKQTDGDIAYSYMIKNDFISAAENFESFLTKEKKHPKREKAIKMLQYCLSQIPYQQVNYGVNELLESDINEALEWFYAAETEADEDLKMEIKFQRKRIASELMDSVQNYKNNMTIDEAETLTLNALKLFPEHKSGYRILAGIYLDKGTLNTDIGNYAEAIQNYLHAVELYPPIEIIVLEKFDQIVNAFIKDAYSAAKAGELHLIVKSLKSIIELNPGLVNRWDPYIIKLESKLREIEHEKSRGYVQNYIKNRKQESLPDKSLVLQLGMTYDEVKAIHGTPQFIDKLEDRNQYHEMWTYPPNLSVPRLYFENNMLIRIEE